MTPLRLPLFVAFACFFSLTSVYNYIADWSFFGRELGESSQGIVFDFGYKRLDGLAALGQ